MWPQGMQTLAHLWPSGSHSGCAFTNRISLLCSLHTCKRGVRASGAADWLHRCVESHAAGSRQLRQSNMWRALYKAATGTHVSTCNPWIQTEAAGEAPTAGGAPVQAAVLLDADGCLDLPRIAAVGGGEDGEGALFINNVVRARGSAGGAAPDLLCRWHAEAILQGHQSAVIRGQSRKGTHAHPTTARSPRVRGPQPR